MAVNDIKEFAHLSEQDVREIGDAMRAIRAEVEASRGDKDANYIKRSILLHRSLEVVGRGLILASRNKKFRWAGAGALGLSKIIENLEIGHNTMHGQWDWMNDPEIHSTTWEWDNAGPSAQWKHSHNFVHHKYTNVLGMDNDLGYGVLRISRDKKWTPATWGQPIYNVILASLFQHAVAFYDCELGRFFSKKATWAETKPLVMQVVRKEGEQALKDYVIFPVLSGRKGWAGAMKANMTANLMRNVWAYLVIFCGHFPDDAEKFTKDHYRNETEDEWYLRQMLGSANFTGGAVLTFLSGNLNYQIEHHLFPDLPSNRLKDISKQVRAIARKYDLPYNTGSFLKQQLEVQRTILRLSLPPHLLRDTADNAAETRSEKAFQEHPEIEQQLGIDPETGKRAGLDTGRKLLRRQRIRRQFARVGALVGAGN